LLEHAMTTPVVTANTIIPRSFIPWFIVVSELGA
jgi:hypothetical protein